MFILVSKIFELVTGSLSGSPLSKYEFLNWLTKSLLYNLQCVCHENLKIQKLDHKSTPIFITNWIMSVNSAISELQ